ncbi:Phosphoribosyl pyrophosphate synthase [Paraburkholderia sabiae]|uniref:ribose-phosphate diphosphokinase n=1 Tax=Paraburkholderia sabiae TaxID=273251 RepID=UPI001CAF43CA|nr:ribose-phosphate diphosphokinase [Paraburkholderia sabiae]CAG9232391.1 Phosphoribosyl pyrophosphate synthase [Paraburkholderia sabiae]
MIRVTAISRAAGKQPVELKTLKFPGGEMHVTVDANVAADELLITAHLPDSATVMTLLLVTDALRRAYTDAPLSLAMPYVPYARQDRVANPGEALSVKVFCDLINAQRYRRVTIQDPHSDVVAALLERVVIEDPLPALRRAVAASVARPALVAPDAGARKRVLTLAKALELDVVFADKTRDTRTGAITGTQIQGELPDAPLLVVDDICDGGRTFTELADALRTRQAAQGVQQELYLYVTHGIFSKGLDPLLTRYATVFARNNWTSDSRCVPV